MLSFYVIKNYPLFNFDDKLPTQINDVELLLAKLNFRYEFFM